MIVKSKILIVLGLFLAGCGGMPNQKLNPELFYKRDINLEINGRTYEGVSVVPYASSYQIDIEPRGADIDMLLITSCHREYSAEKTASGWFIFRKRNRFRYTYNPVPEIENDGDCTLRINTFEKDEGRHAWALIAFEHPKYRLRGSLYCNGVREDASGVSVCQSKKGLTQRVDFGESVEFAKVSAGCAVPRRTSIGNYEFDIASGECIYTVRNVRDERHRLIMIGYEGILIRKEGQ